MSPPVERAVTLRRQRGIALLMVLGFIALLSSVITDFQYSSQVDVRLAYNARDELQAEYNALSALRMRALILKQARQLQSLVGGITQAMQGGQEPGATPQAAPQIPIGAIMEMIPVECGLLSSITKRVERGGAGKLAASEGDSDDFFPGECMATSQSEHSKVAINVLAKGLQNNQSIAMTLLGILSQPSLRKYFEQGDRNSQHAESPLKLLGHIADWVDSDHTELESLGDEDRYYQMSKPPYRSKNAPMDSVAELQLVYGIGDDLFAALKDRVTVHNTDTLIELATAPVEMILGALPAVLRDGTSPDILFEALRPLAGQLMVLTSMGMVAPFSMSMLQTALTTVGLMSAVDPQKLQATFTDRSSTTWYTILAQGQMGHASRKIRAVFQATEGTFYYVRVE